MKEKSRIKKPLIIFLIYCLFWITAAIALHFILGPGINFSVLIPGRDMALEILLISLLFIPISIILSFYIGGYCLSPLFLFIHKKIFGRKTDYGIKIKTDSHKIRYITEGLFVSLLAINISLIILNPYIVSVSTGRAIALLAPDNYVTTFISLLMFTFFISTLLFAGSWFLMDPGIIYSTTRKFKETYRPPEIRAVGRWYGQFLKGYAGVSVILTYYEFITIFFDFMSDELALFLVLLIIFIPFPLFMILPAIPVLLLADKTRAHRIHYITKVARKLGITTDVDVIFSQKE